MKVKGELATVAEIAAEKLRKGEYSQYVTVTPVSPSTLTGAPTHTRRMEYDAIMKAEQSYRREKMSSSPQNRRSICTVSRQFNIDHYWMSYLPVRSSTNK